MAGKTIPEMTNTVSSGTVNSTHSLSEFMLYFKS